MALKRLTTEEMVQISGPWVQKTSEARAALSSLPELAGLLPRIDAAHQALHDAQPGAGDPRLAAVSAEAAQVDLEHDALIRGVHQYLTALATLEGEGGAGAAFLALRDFLLPDGLEAVQRTYRAEAGAAELLKTRLDGRAAERKQLKEIPVLKKHLAHYVEEWMKRAQRLGALEDQRAALTRSTGAGDGARLIAARNQWIRAANALVANAELAGLAEIDEAKDRLIFGPLRLAEKTADRRMKSAPDEPAPAPPPQSAAG